MGAVTNMLSVASIGMGVYQSYDNAKQQKLEAELAADSLEAQAARKDLEAAEALKIGELNMAEHEAASRGERASQKADYAYSGVKVDTGSTLEAAADHAAWSEYERQKIAYESELQSWGLAYDAALLRQEATNTRVTGSNSGVNWGGTALNAASDLAKTLKG